MKLRLKGNEGNSLRLRVSRTEMERLLRGEALEEVVRLAGGSLTYGLMGAETEVLEVRQERMRMMVVVPQGRVAVWGLESEVGIYEGIDLDGGGRLDVVLEKDFACLDASDEENADTFSHPKSGVGC